MHYEQLSFWEKYEPQVDDYVVWSRNGDKDEGWVYFKCDQYITIETHVRPKPKCRYAKNDPHKYIHTLLLCQHNVWYQLKYIKNRRSDSK